MNDKSFWQGGRNRSAAGFCVFFTILTAFPVWTQITIKFVLVREDPYIYVFIKQSNLWQSGFVKAVEFQGWSCSLTISWSHHYCIYIHCIVAELPDQQTSTVSKSKHMLSCKVAVRQQCSEMFSSSWWTNSNSTNCGCNTPTYMCEHRESKKTPKCFCHIFYKMSPDSNKTWQTVSRIDMS